MLSLIAGILVLQAELPPTSLAMALWYSPPLLDRIRDSSRATVLPEPLACDAGGRCGGPRDGDSAAPRPIVRLAQ
jgi:hypothetical protein